MYVVPLLFFVFHLSLKPVVVRKYSRTSSCPRAVFTCHPIVGEAWRSTGVPPPSRCTRSPGQHICHHPVYL